MFCLCCRCRCPRKFLSFWVFLVDGGEKETKIDEEQYGGDWGALISACRCVVSSVILCIPSSATWTAVHRSSEYFFAELVICFVFR